MTEPRLIVLLTDFGESDGFVGILKGVIATINPHIKTIDLSHRIPPQDKLGVKLGDNLNLSKLNQL